MSGVWRRICRADELDPSHPVGHETTGPDGAPARVCVVLSPEGEAVVMLDRCPHRDIRLSGGVVDDGELVCPGHFWRFDVCTGARTDAPAQAATVHDSRVVDGWVEALIPAPPAPVSMREWLLAQARER